MNQGHHLASHGVCKLVKCCLQKLPYVSCFQRLLLLLETMQIKWTLVIIFDNTDVISDLVGCQHKYTILFPWKGALSPFTSLSKSSDSCHSLRAFGSIALKDRVSIHRTRLCCLSRQSKKMHFWMFSTMPPTRSTERLVTIAHRFPPISLPQQTIP